MKVKIFIVNPANRKWSECLHGRDLDFNMTTTSCMDELLYANADRYLVLIHQGVTTLSESQLSAVWVERWKSLNNKRIWWLLYSGGGYTVKCDLDQVHFFRYPIFDQDIDHLDASRFGAFIDRLMGEEVLDEKAWEGLYPNRATEAAVLLAILSAPPSSDRELALSKFLQSPREVKLAYDQLAYDQSALAQDQAPETHFINWVAAIKDEHARQNVRNDLRRSLGQVVD